MRKRHRPNLGDVWEALAPIPYGGGGGGGGGGWGRGGGRPPRREEPREEPREESRRGGGGGGGWAKEERGLWDYIPPEEQVNPKIDHFVWKWVKKNPHNIVDILTGMYGFASRNPAAQKRVLDALEEVRKALEAYPQRTAADEIAHLMEDFEGTEKNYQDFKQALLLALPRLIRSEKAAAQIDALTYTGDRIYEL